MFDSMIDDALCIDLDAEFALAESPLFDPAVGDGATIYEPTLDTAEGEALLLNVSIYA